MRKTKKDLEKEIRKLAGQVKHWQGVSDGWEHLADKRQEELDAPSKGYQVHIEAQCLTCGKKEDAIKTVKDLLDLGFWWVRVDEKD